MVQLGPVEAARRRRCRARSARRGSGRALPGPARTARPPAAQRARKREPVALSLEAKLTGAARARSAPGRRAVGACACRLDDELLCRLEREEPEPGPLAVRDVGARTSSSRNEECRAAAAGRGARQADDPVGGEPEPGLAARSGRARAPAAAGGRARRPRPASGRARTSRRVCACDQGAAGSGHGRRERSASRGLCLARDRVEETELVSRGLRSVGRRRRRGRRRARGHGPDRGVRRDLTRRARRPARARRRDARARSRPRSRHRRRSPSRSGVSERSRTAKRTAKNGSRFAKSDAREGPTRAIAVNQRMFVRKSGPIDGEGEREPHHPAEAGESSARELRDARQRERHPAEREHERADPKRRVAAHQRGDRDRVGGPGRGGRDREQRRRAGSPERPPLAAGRDQPDPDERDQRARARTAARAARARSAVAMMPTKIGVVPSTSPTVEAFVRWTEETKQSWLAKIRTAASPTSSRRSSAIRNERSRRQVNAQKSDGRGEVAGRRVGERLEAVRDHVARDGDVQRPEEHGRRAASGRPPTRASRRRH